MSDDMPKHAWIAIHGNKGDLIASRDQWNDDFHLYIRADADAAERKALADRLATSPGLAMTNDIVERLRILLGQFDGMEGSFPALAIGDAIAGIERLTEQKKRNDFAYNELWELACKKDLRIAELEAQIERDKAHALYVRIDHDDRNKFADALWSELMNWCKKRGVAPSNYGDLFAIVDHLRRGLP